jgi:invasion protein IalB
MAQAAKRLLADRRTDRAGGGAAVAKPAADAPAKAPAAKVAGNFGQWLLVCPEVEAKDGKPPCSLVQALIDGDVLSFHEIAELVKEAFRIDVS